MNKSKEQEFDKLWTRSMFSSNGDVALKGSELKSWHDSQITRLIEEMEGERDKTFRGDKYSKAWESGCIDGIDKAISILRKEL